MYLRHYFCGASSIYMWTTLAVFIVFITFRQTINPQVDGGADNVRYCSSQLKLLHPTEKKTYTICPYDVPNHVFPFVNNMNFTEATIMRASLRWKNFVAGVPRYPNHKYSGRGIVTSAPSGFHKYRRLIAAIKVLRWLKCRLPVEVFVYAGELQKSERKEFERIPNVVVRRLKLNITQGNLKLSAYAIKPASILESTFQHVLWLDSDNIPVRDPEYLFDLPHYYHFTAMFWPDFWITPSRNEIWKILNISCRAEDYEQESGQMLINKQLSWTPLHLALYFMSDETTSKLIYQDKDIYRLAWKALKIPFYFIRKFVAIGGFDYTKPDNANKSDQKSNFCGHTMVQHDPFGEIIFLHLTLLKHYNQLLHLPAEKSNSPLKNYTNLWRVYRRYANSAPYLKPSLFLEGSFMCITFRSDERQQWSPLFEDNFLNQVSPNIVAQYLRLLKGSIIQSNVYATIRVVDRNWTRSK